MSDILANEAAEIAALEKETATTPEPVKTEAAEPEPKQEDLGEHERDAPEGETVEETVELDNKGRFVRHGAFHAEREQRKQYQAKAAEWEARYAADMAKVTERLAQIAQARHQEPEVKAPAAIEIPDVTVDPIGHFQAKTAQLEAKLAEAESWRQGEAKKSDEQVKMERIGAEVSRLETEFAKTNTDYPQAQEFLQKAWAGQAQLLGSTPQEAQKFFATQIVRAAAAQNKNPAEVAYELAKQYGYKKAEAQQPVASKLDTIAKGMAASKTVSTAPGRQAPGTLTAESLANMSDEEFAAKFGGRENRAWDKEMRRVFGAQ